MATTPRKQTGKQLMGQINYGMRNTPMGSGGMGALMGFMGLPFLSKGNGAGKGSGGPWMTVDPVSQSMWQGGYGNRPSVGGGGEPQIEDPPLPPYEPVVPEQQYWTFPQYSQTWAFTPPEPTPYPYPQPFDPKKYGDPFAKSTKK